MNENALAIIESINPVEVFTSDKLDDLLRDIEAKYTNHGHTIETAAGRKAIASTAYEVARSKTRLDDLGKALVADWKEKSRRVDESRKKARDFLDDLKDRVRAPLTEWEAAEAARIEQERLEKEFNDAHEAALIENDLFNRRREIERKEAELARQEEERLAKEQADREAKEAEERRIKEEQERKDREERIAREAAERAQKEAEAKAEAKAKAEREAIECRERKAAEKARLEKERYEREKQAAIDAAAKAERDRIAAEERAKIEKEMAVKAAEEKARQEAERKERDRLAKEAAEKAEIARAKAEADKIAANKAHQKKRNNEALECFTANGIDCEVAKNVIKLIASGKIKHIIIHY